MDRLTRMATFVKVVELGGFSAAARSLGISPSIASTHVQALERHLGARLLHRNTRHVSPTEAGEAYYRRCLDLLRGMEEADEFVATMQSTPRGILRLNTSLLLAPIITPVISQFAARCPQVSVRLMVTSRARDLVEGQYDLAVRHRGPFNHGLVVRKLMDYRLLVCGSPGYFASRSKPGGPSELADHNCLIYTDPEGGEQRTVFDTGEDIALRGNLHSNNVMALVQAAENGQGITVAPDFVVEESVRAGRLVAVLTDFTTAAHPITVVYPHRGFVPLKVRLFVDMLAERLRHRPQLTHRDATPSMPMARAAPRVRSS